MVAGEQLWHWLVSLDLVTPGSEDYWRRLLESALVGGASTHTHTHTHTHTQTHIHTYVCTHDKKYVPLVIRPGLLLLVLLRNTCMHGTRPGLYVLTDSWSQGKMVLDYFFGHDLGSTSGPWH